MKHLLRSAVAALALAAACGYAAAETLKVGYLRSDYGQDTDLVLADLRRLLAQAGKPRRT